MFHPFLVQDCLSLSTDKFFDKEAVVFGEIRLTYGQLDRLSDLLARGLLDRGLRHQDRVIVFSDNSWEIVVALYGILKAGGVFVVLNGGMKGPKLDYIIKDSGAFFLIAQSNKSEVVKRALENSTRPLNLIWIGPPIPTPDYRECTHYFWDNFLGNPKDENPQAVKHEILRRSSRAIDIDLAALIYTSGSTGEPKGVMAPHRAMLSVARSIIQYLGNRSEDVVINALPLSFDYGLYQVLMTIMYGGTVVLERSFAYPVKVLERMEKERVTGFPIVPTMAALLLSMKDIHHFDLSHLRYLTNTAAALPVDHLHRLRKLFPQTRLYSMFGLTECKRVSFLSPEELDRRPSSVGKAIPNCQVFVMDEKGKEVGPGQVGELVIRGTNVMAGYWRAPELTAKTFRPGRDFGEILLFSGDLFKKDEDGFLYFVSRTDDLIKTKGERVSPKEVENILCQIEGVAEAVVLGIPDDVLGQAIGAFCVMEDGCMMTKKEIRRICADRLEPFMIPQYVFFLKSLPKTANGKVDKKILLGLFNSKGVKSD
jgi:long-chain acyl-CoA synthetase